MARKTKTKSIESGSNPLSNLVLTMWFANSSEFKHFILELHWREKCLQIQFLDFSFSLALLPFIRKRSRFWFFNFCFFLDMKSCNWLIYFSFFPSNFIGIHKSTHVILCASNKIQCSIEYILGMHFYIRTWNKRLATLFDANICEIRFKCHIVVNSFKLHFNVYCLWCQCLLIRM